MLLTVVVHAADVMDRDGARLVLDGQAAAHPRLAHLWVDSGYQGRGVSWIEETLGWTVEVGRTPPRRVWGQEGAEPPPMPTGCQVLPWRWAAATHREAFEHAQRMGNRASLAHTLEGIVAWWGEHGELERAARVHGAAEALLNTDGLSFTAFATRSAVHDRFLANARARLGAERWDEAWGAGRSMTADEVAADAEAWRVGTDGERLSNLDVLPGAAPSQTRDG